MFLLLLFEKWMLKCVYGVRINVLGYWVLNFNLMFEVSRIIFYSIELLINCDVYSYSICNKDDVRFLFVKWYSMF